jgi:hypothetical protein
MRYAGCREYRLIGLSSPLQRLTEARGFASHPWPLGCREGAKRASGLGRVPAFAAFGSGRLDRFRPRCD